MSRIAGLWDSMHFMNTYHSVIFILLHIRQNYVCFIYLVTFWERWHFVMVIIKTMHLINLHFWTYLTSAWQRYFVRATENTANQKTGKPFYIWRFFIQPSHHAPRVCRIDCVGHCIWFSSCVYRENATGSCDIPGYCTRERCITRIFLLFTIKSGHLFHAVLLSDRFKWRTFGSSRLSTRDVPNNSHHDIEGCALAWKDVFLRDVWN